MPHNLTYIGNATDYLTFMQRVNDKLMFGWFGTIMLISITAICFLAFIQTTDDTKKAVMGSSIISFIIALLLRGMGLIPDIVLIITILATAFSLFTWKKY